MRRRTAFLAVAVLGAVGAAGACASSGDDRARPRPEPTTEPADVEVEVVTRTETFVDTSRATDPPNTAPERTLVTTLRYPDGGGPYPLVVLAHGANGHPRKFVQLTTAWAQAGYVVAAPAFPNSNDEAPGGTTVGDYVHQPGDVSFVVDEMLRLSDRRDDALFDRVDGGRIGVAGLSMGGATTYGVTFHSCCRDDRIDAAVVMAGILAPFSPGEYDLSGVPLLILHGDADPVLNVGLDADAYAQVSAPKIFVTIHGGGHFQPFEDVVDPADAMVEAVTTDFWDVYLGDEPRSFDRLLADADVAGLTTVQHDAG